MDETHEQQLETVRPRGVEVGSPAVETSRRTEQAASGRPSWAEWLTTTDHKKIGTMYLVTAFAFFIVGGVMALLMRAELARPGLQIMSNEQFNQAFTKHGSIMLLMFAMRCSPGSPTGSCRFRSAPRTSPSRD